MNERRNSRWVVVILALAAALVGARGAAGNGEAAPLPVSLGQGSALWLDGTSSLHDFESRTSVLTITLARDPASQPPADAAGLDHMVRGSRIAGVDVEIPIASMRSGKTGLDRNMQRALKADQFPVIRFHLARYAMAPASAESDTADLSAEGTMSIAGHDRPVTLVARVHQDGSGLWLEGSESLLMSDFGIRPPTMMLGTLKVGDRVTVHYRLLLTPVHAGDSPQSSRTN